MSDVNPVFPVPVSDPLASRKAIRDENGIWRNALGLESSVTFRHVARVWQDRCIPFQQFCDQVVRDDDSTRDQVYPARYLLEIDDALKLPDGAILTDHAVRQLAKLLRLPNTIGELAAIEEGAYAPQIADILRQQMKRKLNHDAQMLVRYRSLPNGLTHVRALFRGILPPLIDNVEMLDMLREAFPSRFHNANGWGAALASHIEDSVDAIQGNVLFPDEMKQEPDSDYGVGVQFCNSEVTTGVMRVSPFLFRAICLNGCIWGRRDGSVRVEMNRDGSLDRLAIRSKIGELVQIALSEGNDLLTLMGYTREIATPQPERVITHLAQKHRLTQEMSRTWFNGYLTETVREGEPFRKTAFGVVQGLTRAAQRWHGDNRIQMEATASLLVAPSLRDDIDAIARRWAGYNSEAANLPEDAVRLWALTGSARD